MPEAYACGTGARGGNLSGAPNPVRAIKYLTAGRRIPAQDAEGIGGAEQQAHQHAPPQHGGHMERGRTREPRDYGSRDRELLRGPDADRPVRGSSQHPGERNRGSGGGHHSHKRIRVARDDLDLRETTRDVREGRSGSERERDRDRGPGNPRSNRNVAFKSTRPRQQRWGAHPPSTDSEPRALAELHARERPLEYPPHGRAASQPQSSSDGMVVESVEELEEEEGPAGYGEEANFSREEYSGDSGSGSGNPPLPARSRHASATAQPGGRSHRGGLPPLAERPAPDGLRNGCAGAEPTQPMAPQATGRPDSGARIANNQGSHQQMGNNVLNQSPNSMNASQPDADHHANLVCKMNEVLKALEGLDPLFTSFSSSNLPKEIIGMLGMLPDSVKFTCKQINHVLSSLTANGGGGGVANNSSGGANNGGGGGSMPMPTGATGASPSPMGGGNNGNGYQGGMNTPQQQMNWNGMRAGGMVTQGNQSQQGMGNSGMGNGMMGNGGMGNPNMGGSFGQGNWMDPQLGGQGGQGGMMPLHNGFMGQQNMGMMGNMGMPGFSTPDAAQQMSQMNGNMGNGMGNGMGNANMSGGMNGNMGNGMGNGNMGAGGMNGGMGNGGATDGVMGTEGGRGGRGSRRKQSNPCSINQTPGQGQEDLMGNGGGMMNPAAAGMMGGGGGGMMGNNGGMMGNGGGVMNGGMGDGMGGMGVMNGGAMNGGMGGGMQGGMGMGANMGMGGAMQNPMGGGMGNGMGGGMGNMACNMPNGMGPNMGGMGVGLGNMGNCMGMPNGMGMGNGMGMVGMGNVAGMPQQQLGVPQQPQQPPFPKYSGVYARKSGKRRFEARILLPRHKQAPGADGEGAKRPKERYIGVYSRPEDAARAVDRAKLKFNLGLDSLNFPDETYSSDEEQRNTMEAAQYMDFLKLQAETGRHGVSDRGPNRWQARKAGYKTFGTFDSEEEAKRVYDIGCIMIAIEAGADTAALRNLKLNFSLRDYIDKEGNLLDGSALPNKTGRPVVERELPRRKASSVPSPLQEGADGPDNGGAGEEPTGVQVDHEAAPSGQEQRAG